MDSINGSKDSMHNKRSENPHIKDDQLFLLTDGELPSQQAQRVQRHLEACWLCRVRLENVESVITGIVDYRNRVSRGIFPRPEGTRQIFLARMQEAAAEGTQTTWPDRLIARLRAALGGYTWRLTFHLLPATLFRLCKPHFDAALKRLRRISLREHPASSQLDGHPHEDEIVAFVEHEIDEIEKTLAAKPELPSPRFIQRVRVSSVWLRPALIGAVALLLIAVLISMRPGPHSETFTASAILAQSAKAEASVASGQVIHRIINLEQKNLTTGSLEATRRIELWQRAGENTAARRLYSQPGKLIAGEWVKADGTKVVYQVAAATRDGRSPGLPGQEIWRLSPSVGDFTRVIPSSREVTVEEQPTVYVLQYDDRKNSSGRGLLRARLVLRRPDLHAIEQTFTVADHAETREYRFVEKAYELRTPSGVDARVFEPTPAAFPSIAPVVEVAKPLLAVATPELQLEVLDRLDQLDLLGGGQIKLERDAQGMLLITGMVASKERQSEIEKGLGELLRNPAIKNKVSSVAEVQNQQSAVTRIVLNDVTVEASRCPADHDLRKYFQEKQSLSDDRVGPAIREFLDTVLNDTSRAQLHAQILKEGVSSFSPSELSRLNDPGRKQLNLFLYRHAKEVLEANTEIRQRLKAAFPPVAHTATPMIRMDADADLIAVCNRLFDLIGVQSDLAWRSFGSSATSAAEVPVKEQRYWMSLEETIALAGQIVGRTKQ